MAKKPQTEAEKIVQQAFPHMRVVKRTGAAAGRGGAGGGQPRRTAAPDAQLPEGKTLRAKYRSDLGMAPAADAVTDGAVDTRAADDDVAAVEIVPETQTAGDTGVSQKRIVLVSKSKKKILGVQG